MVIYNSGGIKIIYSLNFVKILFISTNSIIALEHIYGLYKDFFSPCHTLVSLVSPVLAPVSAMWKLNQCRSEPPTVSSFHWSWGVAASPPLTLTLKCDWSSPPIMVSPGTW